MRGGSNSNLVRSEHSGIAQVTAEYGPVHIQNFDSFRDGLAFLAIMHKVKPEVFDFKTEKKLRGSIASDGSELQTAVEMATKHFSVPPLVGMSAPDVPDVCVCFIPSVSASHLFLCGGRLFSYTW